MFVFANPGKNPETENLPPLVEDRERPKKQFGCASLVINRVYLRKFTYKACLGQVQDKLNATGPAEV